MDRVDDVLNARGNLFDRVLADAAVVRADHEDDDLRLDAFEFAVLDAPQDVLGAVATDAEVSGLILSIFFFEEGLLAVPAGGDGVAKEHDLGFALLGDFHEGLVLLLEARIHLAVATDFRGGDIGWLGGNLGGGGLDGDLGGVGGRLLGLVGAIERNLSQQGEAQEDGEFGFHQGYGGSLHFGQRPRRVNGDPQVHTCSPTLKDARLRK